MGRGFGRRIKDHAREKIVINACTTWSSTATPVDWDRARNCKNTWRSEERERVCVCVCVCECVCVKGEREKQSKVL